MSHNHGKSGRKKGKGKIPNPLKGSDNIIRVPFHKLSQSTLVGGVGSQAFSPDGIGTRTTQLADAYGKYRFVELQYRLLPATTLSTACLTMCYYPGILDTFPTNATQNSESPHVTILAKNQTMPSAWSKLDHQSTQSYFTWYKTKAGSLDPSEENAGYFVWCSYSSATDIFLYEIAGIIEFSGPIDIASTPAEHRARLIKKERERLSLMGVKLLPMDDPIGDGDRAECGSRTGTPKGLSSRKVAP